MKAEKITELEKELSRGFTLLDYSKKGLWRGIQKFKKELNTTDKHEFLAELEEQHGIKLKLVEGIILGFAPEYEVVDKQKFVMFVLKYVQQ